MPHFELMINYNTGSKKKVGRARLPSAIGRVLRHSAVASAASLVTHCVRSSVQWPPYGVAPYPHAEFT